MVTTTLTDGEETITVEHGEHYSRHIGFIHLAEPDRNTCTTGRRGVGSSRGRRATESGSGGGAVGGPNKLARWRWKQRRRRSPRPPSAHASVAPVDHSGTARGGKATLVSRQA